MPKKTESVDAFAGGSGAWVSVQPLGFLVVSSNGEVKLLEMTVNASKENAIVNKIPDVIDKIADLFKKDDADSSKSDKADKTTD